MRRRFLNLLIAVTFRQIFHDVDWRRAHGCARPDEVPF